MIKRLAVLTALVWAGLYICQQLVGMLFDLIGAPLVESAWALWLALALPVVVAAWMVGRWRGLTVRRLAMTSIVALLVVTAVWAATSGLLSVLPASALEKFGEALGEAALGLLYLAYAVEAAAVSWLVAGISLRFGAHRTSAST